MRTQSLFNSIIVVGASILLMACGQDSEQNLVAASFKTVEWTDLMPQEDLEALLNPPEFLNDIIDGSAEDVIDSQIQSAPETPPQSAYEKALVSDTVVEEFNNKSIRVPGFIVPLEFDENLVLTEFFLVPYFGACLHLPPPPPNQIIYVKHSGGFELDSTEQPYWVSGTLSTQSEINSLAHAAYSMTAEDISLYTDGSRY